MNLFANGRKFNFVIRCCPPRGKPLPFLAVEMMGLTGVFQPVIEKMDTGAFLTMLDCSTAEGLGFDPKSGTLNTAHTANGTPLDYRIHSVLVQIGNHSGTPVSFPLKVGIAEKIKRNLFGIDWLQHLCLALDAQAVHFLRD